MYLSRQTVICLPTEHLGVHKNSCQCVPDPISTQSSSAHVLRAIPKPVSTGVENGSRLNWKNLWEQKREPTTNSTHIWCRRQDSNPGHIGRRRALPHHRTTLAPQQFHLSLFSTSEMFSSAHDQRTRRAHRAEAPRNTCDSNSFVYLKTPCL